MNNVRLSVVIPVYNVENYLRECLDSVVLQNFNNIEVICVYGESKDNSLKILRLQEKLPVFDNHTAIE